MNLGVDLRCLQTRHRTGVGEVAWQILRSLGQLDPSLRFSGYTSGRGALSPGLPINQLTVCSEALPSKLTNLLHTLGLGQGIVGALESDQPPLDVLWLPNPGFTHLNALVPTVLTIHDLSFIHMPEWFRLRGRLWYFPVIKQQLARGPQGQIKAVAVSQHTADDLVENYPLWNKHVTVVPLGVNEIYRKRLGKSEVAAVRAKYALPERYVLSLGTLEPRKNHVTLVRAYIKLAGRSTPTFDLVLCGAWGWKTQELQRELQLLPAQLKSHVHVLGFVANEDKPALYQAALIFAYPSFYEGFGLPVLESMASGTPVLASHSSSLPEVVGEAGLLLDPWRVLPWVEALAWLIDDDKARAHYSELGVRRAQQFSWTTTARSYYSIFSSRHAHSD